MKIIIVEDDSLTALFITETLEDLGHEVLGSFDSASDMLEVAKIGEIDLVFIDIELNSKMDGIECAVRLRQQYRIPSIFLTSYQNSETIHDAMAAEPLGYLIKPVSENEIEAALAVAKRILRANTPLMNEYLQLGQYTYHFKHKTLNNKEGVVKLSKNEYKIVDLLCKSYGNIVENEHLICHIWEDTYNKEDSLRELIYRLRKKLPEISIQSSSKVGYFLEGV